MRMKYGHIKYIMETEIVGKILTPVWTDSHKDSEDDFLVGKKMTWKRAEMTMLWRCTCGPEGGDMKSAYSETWRWVHVLAPLPKILYEWSGH